MAGRAASAGLQRARLLAGLSWDYSPRGGNSLHGSTGRVYYKYRRQISWTGKRLCCWASGFSKLRLGKSFPHCTFSSSANRSCDRLRCYSSCNYGIHAYVVGTDGLANGQATQQPGVDDSLWLGHGDVRVVWALLVYEGAVHELYSFD